MVGSTCVAQRGVTARSQTGRTARSVESLRSRSQPFSTALVQVAFQNEVTNLRDSGYDLNAIDPSVWVSALYALWERAANLASDDVFDRLGRGKQLNPQLVLSARDATRAIASSALSITTTTREALTGLQPWEIDAYYEEQEAFRVGVIADTEMNAALSFGHYETAREFFRFKAWRTQQDTVVRDAHRSNELEGAIPFDSEFQNGQLRPHFGTLAEDIINCRCWLDEIELA